MQTGNPALIRTTLFVAGPVRWPKSGQRIFLRLFLTLRVIQVSLGVGFVFKEPSVDRDALGVSI